MGGFHRQVRKGRERLSRGDVVTADFAEGTGIKRRRAIVASSDLYQARRPDLILAILTTQVESATVPADYVLQDWTAAGLLARSRSVET